MQSNVCKYRYLSSLRQVWANPPKAAVREQQGGVSGLLVQENDSARWREMPARQGLREP
jgi:hypothetical protein